MNTEIKNKIEKMLDVYLAGKTQEELLEMTKDIDKTTENMFKEDYNRAYKMYEAINKDRSILKESSSRVYNQLRKESK